MSIKKLSEALKEVLAKPAVKQVEEEVVDTTEQDEVQTEEDVIEDADEVTDEEVVEEDVVDETTAADSLHPAARPVTDDPKSKFSMISKAIGHMAAMSSEELTKWFTQAIAQSQTYNQKIPGGASGSNQSSIDMKPSDASISKGPKTAYAMPKLGVKEDVEKMFEGFELSEDFREQATTLFEAAVTARVLIENARLEEEYETAYQEALDEELETITNTLADQIDNYITYAAEQFMEENKVAIESTLRNELIDEFITGLSTLFQEHYFNIPENKIDVIETLSDKITDLETKFNEQLEVNRQLTETLTDVEREKVVDLYMEGMPLSEADKFLKLVEGVDFDGDLEAYSKKLAIIKEQYFGKANKAKSNIEEETFEGDTTSEVAIDPVVAKYVQSINKLNRI